jgi:hypothetical protein
MNVDINEMESLSSGHTFGENCPVCTQEDDLASMKRQKELRAALANHVRHLYEGSTTFTLLVNLIDESSKPLAVGAMPEWYEDEAKSIGITIREQAAALLALGQRLEEEYLD